MKASVPYEVFLHVIEQLIEMSKDRYDIKVWSLGYEHSLATKLVLHELNSTRVRSETIAHQRHQKLRLALQINQQSRRMVEKTYARLPMMVANPDGLTRGLSPVKAFVPLTDEYIPFFTSLQEGREFEQFIYNQAVLLPSSSGYALLTRIEKIFLPFLRYLTTKNAESLATLVRLPNLKSIVFNTVSIIAGYSVPMYDDPELLAIHPGWMKIEGHRYPDMKIWEERHGRAFRKLWHPFERRDIELFAFRDNIKPAVMKMKVTKEGIRVNHLFPDCSCCPPDIEYNDKES
ncbi:hypothetical protein BDP55DRAFT_755187 [Colletotrichum godetiae]|uniref:Uncharacterized protein n=1 Tax=Colletotrichum godetiae TaxID=1209918 RepID=A0AAJ0AAR0_9PEZI|nr:uncharacterized protein BDP55DRAFT_755187 [Colletotrichum godetiae]KAK1659683.1 hypothetical protein BDP55DRAFT_755187 [Colletotrichum godetiae]